MTSLTQSAPLPSSHGHSERFSSLSYLSFFLRDVPIFGPMFCMFGGSSGVLRSYAVSIWFMVAVDLVDIFGILSSGVYWRGGG